MAAFIPDIDRPAFDLAQARGPRGALVVASPHSGRIYPDDLIAASKLSATELRASEDSFVDALFARAPALGVPLLCATYARAYLDLNREPYELDPGMFADRLPSYVNTVSARVSVGLGTIARVVSEGRPIYARKLFFAEADARIRRLHVPYHEALETQVRLSLAAHGFSVLVDAHSMPSTILGGRRAPVERQADIVLGDRLGSSCHHVITATAERTLQGLGYRVVRNAPYAGGYTTRHYGLPDEGRHVLQIEINRALYMDEARFEKLPVFGRIAGDMSTLLQAIKLVPAAELRRQSVAAAQ